MKTELQLPRRSAAKRIGDAMTIEARDIAAIAEAHGTPLHVYSRAEIESSYREIDHALGTVPHRICYAMKANANAAVLECLRSLGAGADVVSGGEMALALAAGFEPSSIVFSGVGKTDPEIQAAITEGIRAIHIESAPELEVTESIARSLGQTARVGLRINPDIDPKTHPYIATGLSDSKFGLDLATARKMARQCAESSDLELESIACHIGSQIGDVDALRESARVVALFARECRDLGAYIHTIDCGGGWPISYGDEESEQPSFAAIGRAIREGLEDVGLFDVELVVEPGRALVGTAGVLVVRVLYVKEQEGKRFVVVDGAMTELLRPSLYGAYHAIEPVRVRPGVSSPCDVVGPVCETGDFFAIDRMLPPVERGDLLLIHSTGAYGAAMESRYNARPLAAEIWVDGERDRVSRKRETVAELVAARLPKSG